MFESFRQPRDPFKKEGSGYQGSGFKYEDEEFKAKVNELVAKGIKVEEATQMVTDQEEKERNNIKESHKENAPRYDLGDKKDWAA